MKLRWSQESAAEIAVADDPRSLPQRCVLHDGRHHFSFLRRIVRSATSAMDDQIMDLSLLRVHQHCTAAAADVIDRVGAGDQGRRRADDVARPRRWNEFQCGARTLMIAHDALRCRRGHSQSPRPDTRSLGDGTIVDLCGSGS